MIGKLVVNDFQKILMETKQLLRDGGLLPFKARLFGDGHAAERIVQILMRGG